MYIYIYIHIYYYVYPWSPVGVMNQPPTMGNGQAYLAHRPELKREQMAGEVAAVEVTLRDFYAHGFV